MMFVNLKNVVLQAFLVAFMKQNHWDSAKRDYILIQV